jgi:cytosol aminopeptidase
LSTLTGAIGVALGYHFAGVFSSSDSLWSDLKKAGKIAGEGLWRMPLDDVYKPQITSNVADLKNVGGRGGGSCTAAIFLKEFVPGLTPEVNSKDEANEKNDTKIKFAHIGIYKNVPYSMKSLLIFCT